MRANEVKVESLRGLHCVPGLKFVMLNILDATVDLIRVADMLPRRLANKRLAMESQTIINIAHTLHSELRGRDPLAERVKLSRWQYCRCCASGALKILLKT